MLNHQSMLFKLTMKCIIAEIEGRMDSAQYVDILDHHLSQSLKYLEIPADEAIFK